MVDEKQSVKFELFWLALKKFIKDDLHNKINTASVEVKDENVNDQYLIDFAAYKGWINLHPSIVFY